MRKLHKALTEKRDASPTRNEIKIVAQRLFAASGFDNVTTRQIIEAVGLRNPALINYHFGSKTDLIEELIRDVLRGVEVDRHRRLDAIEGRPSLRGILRILAMPLDFAGEDPGAERSQTATRFMVMVLINHRDEWIHVNGPRLDSGTRRCLFALRRQMTHVSSATARHRIALVVILIVGALAAREAMTPDDVVPVEALLSAAEAILMAPDEGAGDAA